MPHENVKPKHIIVASSPVVPQLEDTAADTWNCTSETHEGHALSHELLYWLYHHTRFEDKQAISVYVPVWDLHNWQTWHIWSFLSSAPLWSFSDLAAGDVYRKTKLVECAEFWWLFIPAKGALQVKRATHWGAGLGEMKGNWEGDQGQSGRFTNLILGPSLTTSLPFPKSSEAQPLLFLPQNCNTECVSPNPFQVWVRNGCCNHITKNELLEFTSLISSWDLEILIDH